VNKHFLLSLFLLANVFSFKASNAHHSDIHTLYEIFEIPELYDKHLDLVRHLAKKPYKEVQYALIERFAIEASLPYDIANHFLMKEILVALAQVGTEEHLEDYKYVFSQAKLRSGDYSHWTTLQLDYNYDRMVKEIRQRTEVFPSLADSGRVDILELDEFFTPNSLETISLPLGKSSERIQKFLNERVVGQPHIVEKITDIIIQDKALQKRESPEVLYLMGQPGTGKDTSAMAMTDAIHSKEGAWREHMFEIGSLSDEKDMWGVLGSATGYLGSDNFPPFLDFLVEHSGGRYEIDIEETAKGPEFSIHENPDWKGHNLPGFSKPSDAVVFLNEFHDWGKDIKNMFIKRALEKGTIPINNPNGGVAEIRVPVTFIMASNEGIGLVSSRDHLGRRFGKPLSYDKSFALWEKNHNSVHDLKDELKKTGAGIDSVKNKGNSEELISRIPDDRLMLMKPLSPGEIRFIAEIKLISLRKKISSSTGNYRKVHLRWDKNLLEFLQTYDYSAEDGARPMQSKVESLIQSTFFEAAKTGIIPTNVEANVKMSAKKKSNGSWDLQFNIEEIDNDNNVTKKTRKKISIKETLKNIPPKPLSDAEIDDLIDMPTRMKKKLFGAEQVVERVAEALLVSEERRRANQNIEKAKKGARSFMFLGPSSTGKTELAKVVSDEVFGSREELAIIDFNGIRSKEQVHEMIYGKKNAAGIPEPSDFMLEFDRRNGKVIFLLDEIANVGDPEALVPLYQLLDEPLVSLFSDGKERNMSDVIVIMTGNAGEEWYQSIPDVVPEDIQRMARDEIYQAKTNSYREGRRVLEKYFREAFINRVGEPNIFFFPSLSHQAQRELLNLKMKLMFDDLKPTASGIPRGWNFKFESFETYSEFLENIEEDAFNVKEQGRSIDRYVNTVIGQKIKKLALENKFPNGAEIVLSFEGVSEEDLESDVGAKKIIRIRATDSNTGQNILIAIPGRSKEIDTKTTEMSKMITAFHEAGHAVVGHTFFSSYEDPFLVKIIPGVTEISGEMVYYAGVAGAEKKIDAQMTRENVIRSIAKLAGGYMAEKIVTVGERHSAGKSNDMQRATAIADRAILQWGLSDKWGYELAKDAVDLTLFIQTLPEEAKILLQKERQKLLRQGEKMAKKAILLNFNVFVEMANQLATQGELSRSQMKTIFDIPTFAPESKWNRFQKIKAAIGPQALKAKWNEIIGKFKGHGLEIDIRSDIRTPSEVADIEDILQEKKKLEVSLVENYHLVPYVKASSSECNSLMSSILLPGSK
jgi:ATP-dependent Clp protease ATP-binding subunit ClpA